MSGAAPLAEWLRLDGRSALVTGAGRGIGRSIALTLAAQGAAITVACGADQARAEQTVSDIRDAGGQAVSVKADLADEAAADMLVAAAREAFGPPDILVLNAAHQERMPLEALSRADIDRHLGVNVVSAIALMQACLLPMAERGWGRVLTIGSVQQVRPNPDLAVYAASKAAMHNVVVGMARRFGSYGVTVNNLAPGLIETERNADLVANGSFGTLETRIPLRAAGRAEDCAAAAAFLCSDAARYVTGANLFVDGGLNLPD